MRANVFTPVNAIIGSLFVVIMIGFVTVIDFGLDKAAKYVFG